ncbi:MAG TPA: radical SAM family heme chaperone HemW [Actinomycetota bacterium]|nr:radical SAM family heme chaperone HemW [Actinomycetota bacterium]
MRGSAATAAFLPASDRLDDRAAEAAPGLPSQGNHLLGGLPEGNRRSGDWQEHPGLGVYVHIPFCRHRCAYCDFNTYEGLDALHAPYVDALLAEISGWRRREPDLAAGLGGRAVTSVFIGGGTPTLLPASALGVILRAIGDLVGIENGAEITVEANPETVDESYFTALLEEGFNRVSIGVQSLASPVLAALDRAHSAGVALAAISAARAAGVPDINADLIYGSPAETAEGWRRSLTGIIDAETDHISAYALTVEEGTPLARAVASGRTADVDPDVQAERFAIAEEVLGAAGFERYEISNWARRGRASAHNVLYWSAGDYLAFGAGAHGHLDGTRWWRTRLPRDFVDLSAADTSTIAGREELDERARAADAMTLGLRLTSGIDLDGFRRRFGGRYLDETDIQRGQMEQRGLLVCSGRQMRLTESATFVANEVFCRLL